MFRAARQGYRARFSGVAGLWKAGAADGQPLPRHGWALQQDAAARLAAARHKLSDMQLRRARATAAACGECVGDSAASCQSIPHQPPCMHACTRSRVPGARTHAVGVAHMPRTWAWRRDEAKCTCRRGTTTAAPTRRSADRLHVGAVGAGHAGDIGAPVRRAGSCDGRSQLIQQQALQLAHVAWLACMLSDEAASSRAAAVSCCLCRCQTRLCRRRLCHRSSLSMRAAAPQTPPGA